MATEASIRIALEKHLEAIIGISVAWENVEHKPATGIPWARSTLNIEAIRKSTLGDQGVERFEGLLLVELFEPQGSGASAADDLAAVVRGAFLPGVVLIEGTTRVHIRYAERAQGRVDTPWYVVPLSIAWYCYA